MDLLFSKGVHGPLLNTVVYRVCWKVEPMLLLLWHSQLGGAPDSSPCDVSTKATACYFTVGLLPILPKGLLHSPPKLFLINGTTASTYCDPCYVCGLCQAFDIQVLFEHDLFNLFNHNRRILQRAILYISGYKIRKRYKPCFVNFLFYAFREKP